MKCIDCQHFEVLYEPTKLDFGRARCDKYDLIVDFPTRRKLKKLECVEETDKSTEDMYIDIRVN